MLGKFILVMLVANVLSVGQAWMSDLNIMDRLLTFYRNNSFIMVIFHLCLVVIMVLYYQFVPRNARLWHPSSFPAAGVVQGEKFGFVRHFKKSKIANDDDRRRKQSSPGAKLKPESGPRQTKSSRVHNRVGRDHKTGNQATHSGSKTRGTPGSYDGDKATTSQPGPSSPYKVKAVRGGRLTRDQIAAFKEVFQMFDLNGDGYINTKELRYVLLSLGQRPSNSELADIIQEVDVDGDGTVELTEFLFMMDRRMKESNWEDSIKEAFSIFDRDQDGFIKSRDLQNLMDELGMRMTKEEIKEMIQITGIRNPHQISYKEFLTMFKNYK